MTGGLLHSDLTAMVTHPDGRTIYACDFTWGGIFRSVDGGLKWDRMPTDGLASDRIWTLGLDPAAPDELLAGSSAGGLHRLVPASGALGVTGSQQTAAAPAPSAPLPAGLDRGPSDGAP